LRTRSRAEEDRKLVSPLPPPAPVFCAHVPRRRRRRRRRRTDPLFLFVGAQSIVAAAAAAAAPLFNLSFHAICNKGTNGVAPFRGVHGDPGPPASLPRSFLVALIFLETSAERHSAA